MGWKDMGSLPVSQLHFLCDRITTTFYEGKAKA
nr:MAG TPA: hypothetical protein [Caudoviricetes sp.]